MPRKNKYATAKDITRFVKKKLKLDENIVRQVIDLYIEEIKSEIINGRQVRLSEFGTFELTKWNTGLIYDINTKQKVEKQIKTVLFHPSEKLKEKVLRN
ncbi:MAG: HU family DNA-binding protein [Candidatus Berkelbacteria bacterium]|nr:HU family DNA-binding protein [Candidatus Berkelbacteria bacterium]